MGTKTWDYLRDELAYQTENSVRMYDFVTQRSSTIAAAAIMNAIEQVANSQEHDLLMKTLICVMKQFDFERPHELLEVKHKLNIAVKQNQESETDAADEVLSQVSFGSSQLHTQHECSTQHCQ